MGPLISESTRFVSRLDPVIDHNQGEQAASELLEEFWDGRLPVNPIRIARSLGIKVFNASFEEDVSGALVKAEGSDPSILLNSEDSRHRKRFTCAHEIGHFIGRAEEPEKYECVDYRDPRSSTGSIEEERFADSFAANLLMPKPAVEALHSEGLPDFRLAIQFGVSREAMRNRLDELGLLR
jgi:Zn-dependent peptidase ImmA (M78 family)